MTKSVASTSAAYASTLNPSPTRPGPRRGPRAREEQERRDGLLRSALARARPAPTGTRSNDHAVGRVHDRLVLLIPAHAVMLVSFAAEHLDDLSSARRLAVHAMRLNPVTYAGAGLNGLIRHQFTSFDAIKPLGPQLRIGDRAKPAAVIYGCAPPAQK